ncbi:MAG: hypothetical protein U9Q82_00375 [Chloroflexota bacterium]|nr:hypothetical protein [Chloroflexota bacterium]
MAVYKVSYVIKDSDHPGGIVNLKSHPNIGDKIRLGELNLEILEIFELMPPQSNFYYLHATCKPIDDKKEA